MNWSPVIGAAGYEIRGRRVGTTGLATILVGNSQTFRDVFGLLSGFSYEWTIRSWCDQLGNTTSEFLPFDMFTTLNGGRTAGHDAWYLETSDFEVSIWPNPAAEVLELEILGSNSALKGNITINDAAGREVKSFNAAVNHKTIINVHHLANGFYHIFVEMEGVVKHRKLVITK